MERVRPALCVLLFCGLSVTGLAQEERATPVVTAAGAVEKVRFAGSPSTVQMRIEVRSAGGALVYDSDWKDGNLLDWLPRGSSDQPLAYGAYRLVMKSKNLAGQTSEKETALHVDSRGVEVEGQPSASPRITLNAHDGEIGQLITTSGDLSFRFGDFLNRKDTEVMRLTREGNLGIGTDKPQAPLDVNGLIRTSKGIMFPDGTILTTADGGPAAGQDSGGVRNRPGSWAIIGELDGSKRKTGTNAGRLTPRPNFAPAFQFVVGDTGVSVGTTNPAFRLDVTGDINTAAGYDIAGTRTLSANGGNTSVGFSAGPVSGTSNSFFGTQSGQAVTIGAGNGFFGYQSGATTTTGSNNAYFGNFAGVFADADYDTFCGSNAGFHTTSGASNTAIGRSAFFSNTTGSNNIAVGDSAGVALTTGNNNIDIGNAGTSGEANTIRIGTAGVQARTFIAGVYGQVAGGGAQTVYINSSGQLGTVGTITLGTPGTISSRRYKFDINSIGDATDGLMRLRPVTFRYLAQGDDAPLQYGLIAEEVAEVYPEMVTRNKEGEVEAVMYQFLAPMLLSEVQTQHRQIEEQQAENKTIGQRTTALESENAALRNQLKRLIQRVDQLEGKRHASE